MILKSGDLPETQNARRFGGRRISEREQYAVLAVLLFAMLDRRPETASGFFRTAAFGVENACRKQEEDLFL